MKTWAQKNGVEKYDIISFALECEDEGVYMGEVSKITTNFITIKMVNGEYQEFTIDDIIDLDHIKRADRNDIYRH